MGAKISIFRLVAALIIMGVFPVIAIGNHLNIQSQDNIFEVSAQISPRLGSDSYDIFSEINVLSLSELSGVDKIDERDIVLIHMAKGPGNVAYPFSITRENSILEHDGFAFTIKGQIVKLDGERATLKYNFESFLPTRKMEAALINSPYGEKQVRLAVNSQSTPRLTGIIFDGHTYRHSTIYNPLSTGTGQQ